MSMYKKLGKDTLIFTVGNVGSSLITFLLLPLFTNYLTTAEYGIVDFITISITLLMPIFTLNIADAVIRFGIDKEYDNKKTFTTSILFFGLVSLILFPITFITINVIRISFNNSLIMLVIFTQFLFPILQQFTRALNKLKLFAFSDILYTFLFAILNIVFLTNFKLGIEGYFLSLSIAKFTVIVFLLIFAKLYKYFEISSFSLVYLKTFIKYSLPLIPNSLSWWIINVSDRYLLALFCGTGVLGIYSVANKIPTILTTINGIFTKAWQISSFQEFNSKHASDFYSNVMRYLIIFMTTIGMLLITFVNVIVSIFIGDSFYSAIYYIPILIIGFIFSSFSSFLGTIYTASKNTKGILKSTIFSAILNIIINIILIPIFGPIIAAWSTAVSYIFLFIYRLIDTKKYLKLVFEIKKIILIIFLLIFQAINILVIDNYVYNIAINLLVTIVYCYSERNNIIFIINNIISKAHKNK